MEKLAILRGFTDFAANNPYRWWFLGLLCVAIVVAIVVASIHDRNVKKRQREKALQAPPEYLGHLRTSRHRSRAISGS
jgi:bacteriorhodopsin